MHEIFALYASFGDADYIDEPVSQLEHMSQAAQLAESEGYPPEVILSAFFMTWVTYLSAQGEELGQMGGFGVMDHEKLGIEDLLKLGFPEVVARLVESHVEAKRYLPYKNPDYFNRLSEASRQTFIYQGGVMSPKEAGEFEADENHDLIQKMREWDEKAKETLMPMLSLEKYKK